MHVYIVCMWLYRGLKPLTSGRSILCPTFSRVTAYPWQSCSLWLFHNTKRLWSKRPAVSSGSRRPWTLLVDDDKGVHAGWTTIKPVNHETFRTGYWWLFDDQFRDYVALDILGIIIINEPGISFSTNRCNGMTEGIEFCSSVPCKCLKKWNCDLSEPFWQERK